MNKIEEKEALVRKIRKELIKLWKADSELGLIPLEKPIRHGWYKHLVLRKDIARREDAALFQEIIEICGYCVWGSDKNRANKNWESDFKHYRYWQWEGFSSIEKKEFNKLSSKAKEYFVEYESYWCPWSGSVKRYFCKVPKYYFETGFSKAYITHRKVLDSELNKKIDELESKLISNELYAVSYNGIRWPDKWISKRRNRKTRHRAKIALKSYDEKNF